MAFPHLPLRKPEAIPPLPPTLAEFFFLPVGSQKGTYCGLAAQGRNTFLREGLSAEFWMTEASLAKSQGKNLPEEAPRWARP